MILPFRFNGLLKIMKLRKVCLYQDLLYIRITSNTVLNMELSRSMLHLSENLFDQFSLDFELEDLEPEATQNTITTV